MRRVGIGAIFLGLLPARSPGLVRGPHRAVTTYTRSVEPHRQLIQKHWASSSRHYGLLASDKEIEKRTYRWIVEIVYGLGLCPWSGNVIRKGGKGRDFLRRLWFKKRQGVNFKKRGLWGLGKGLVGNSKDSKPRKKGPTCSVWRQLRNSGKFLKLAK